MTINDFKSELQKININISEYQLKQFERYYELLIEWNQKMNLTAITEKKEVYEKHFFDSILASIAYKFNDQSICDIGAGAGFPSIPLKIIYPNLHITIVDSLNKRITFLNFLVKELNLSNVVAINERAEEHVKDNREQYDIVLARAVARLNVLLELCTPLVKDNGMFIALKGKQAEEEITEAENALKVLNCEIINKYEYALLNEQSKRYIILINKKSKTSLKYPRNYGQIKKKPL